MNRNRGLGYLQGILGFFLLALVMAIVILSIVPPVAKDELVHHLALPKLYLKHGGMYEIPFMPFSYYPMNLQLFYLIPLYFGNDIIPKFIHFTFALLTAWLLFGYLKKRVGKAYAWFGVLFFLSIPIIVMLSISAYVDLGVLFFSFAALLLLFKWRETGFKRRFLVLSGVMAGLAMGTKYNAMVTTVLLALFVPLIYTREGNGKFFRSAHHGIFFLSVALLVFSPWMARNYAWKSNPIYPLYEHKFNPQKNLSSATDQGENESIDAGVGIFVIREGIYQEKWWEIALVPLRVFIHGQDGSPKHFDGKLNPFLLLFSLFAFWRMRDEQQELVKEKKIILAFVVLFFAVAFFTSDFRIRYIAPTIPLMVILSVSGIERIRKAIERGRNPRSRSIALALFLLALCLAIVYNGRYLVSQFKELEPLGYITGGVSRDEYLERHRPEYAAMRFMNHHLPQNAKVMLIFLGSRGYYCERDYIYGDEALGPVFLNSEDSQEMHYRLRSMGVTHLLIYDPLFGRWVRDNIEDRARGVLKLFFSNYVKLLYTEKGFSVFSLEDASS